MDTKNHPEPSAWSSRPNYTPRQLLTAEQLNAGIQDELKRQRLLNRAIHGYGVVEGFGLEVGEDGKLVLAQECLELTGGLAIDRYGRMLSWNGGRIGMHDIVGHRPQHTGKYTLSAHFACQPPRTDGCLPLVGEQSQWWKEGVVFTLRDKCQPADRNCPDHPAGSCISHNHYLCRRTGALPGDNDDDVKVSGDVAWVVKEPRTPDCPTGCDAWVYDPDPDVGVPIACVEICDLANDSKQRQAAKPGDPDCEPRYGFCPTVPDPCGVRPYVYRNPLLYELLRDCDVQLSRVHSISWQDWIDRGWRQRVPWTDFAERITSDEGFEVHFTRPIKVETIHAASVFLTALTHERRSDYWVSQRVPLNLAWLDQDETVASGVRLTPDPDWVAAEVTGRRSTLFSRARFELTIRGQLLRDGCGQMLDARPVDIPGQARGQSMPGGDFVSAFRVERHHRDQDGRARAQVEESSPARGTNEQAADNRPLPSDQDANA